MKGPPTLPFAKPPGAPPLGEIMFLGNAAPKVGVKITGDMAVGLTLHVTLHPEWWSRRNDELKVLLPGGMRAGEPVEASVRAADIAELSNMLLHFLRYGKLP